ncbi:zinc finger 3-like [Olea europaea subsp. europaea]|uniref:Zinc finger 3-like n=1 Tax=Olea europaea subsp. europaea TaxID=158383 RepID=A0A8S0T3J3_OLEEU|nr:zinc finger 3-like [Olea europaea subsp. europaea]
METPRAEVNSPVTSHTPETLKRSPSKSVEKKRACTREALNRKLKLARHSTTLHGMHVTDNVREWVYGCKYCDKKFITKQALGGHQNAHTVERVIERNAREGVETNFGHVGCPSYRGIISLLFKGSFNRGPEIFNQSMTNRSYNPQSNGSPNSNLPMIQEPHAPEPLQGFTHGYLIWQNTHSTDSQFIAPLPGMESHTRNFLNSTFGTTRTMLGMSGGLSTASSSQYIYDTNVRAETNSKIPGSTKQKCQESELDLSLKL